MKSNNKNNDNNIIIFNIKSSKFYISKSNILKYPDSILAKLVLDSNNKEIILNESDPDIFKYIEIFFNDGILFDKKNPPNIELSILKKISHEAEIYDLNELSIACHNGMGMLLNKKLNKINPKVSCDLIFDPQEGIIKSISQLYLPYCISGTIKHCRELLETSFYKDSTFDKPNVDSLLQIAKSSPFGMGKETLIDPNVRKSMEIKAEELNAKALMCFEEAVPMEKLRVGRGSQLTIKPYKLVIYQPGDHFLEHRDTVRAPNHIGTLTIILNTKFEGGEFCIKHGDKVEKYSEPLTYVAMFGDCLHWIEPISSGVRCSMIYDILTTNESHISCDDKLHSGIVVRHFCAYTFPILTSPEAHYDPPDVLPSQLVSHIQRLLSIYNSVVIALHHMYPLIQIERNQLKGSDYLLFEKLNSSSLNDDLNYKVYLLPIVASSTSLDGEMKKIEIKAIPNITEDRPLSDTARDKIFTTNNNVLVLAEEFKYILSRKESEYNGNEGFLENLKYLMTAIVVTKLNSTSSKK